MFRKLKTIQSVHFSYQQKCFSKTESWRSVFGQIHNLDDLFVDMMVPDFSHNFSSFIHILCKRLFAFRQCLRDGAAIVFVFLLVGKSHVLDPCLALDGVFLKCLQ